jgi:hypothetical protein
MMVILKIESNGRRRGACYLAGLSFPTGLSLAVLAGLVSLGAMGK